MTKEPAAPSKRPTEILQLTTLVAVIALGWGVFCLQQLLRGAYIMALIDGGSFLSMLALSLWSRRSTNPRRAQLGAHIVLVISCTAIVGVSMYSGQSEAVAPWYLTAVPLFAAYTLGRREAIFWTVIALLLMLTVYISPALFTVEYEYLPDGSISLVSKFILLLMLLSLAVASRRVTDANVAALAQREQVIRERARELAEARDEALAAGKAKDLFLANISHEIRTPLNGVIGMTSVLLDSVQSAEQREMLRMVQRSSAGLLTILNEILDFSKLEASAVTLESIPFDLLECVEDAVDLFGRSAFDKHLDLYVHCDSKVPRWIMGDITRLRQVLLNLIGNAIKFTEQGEVCVRIQNEGDEFHFAVSDTGVGVRDGTHEQIFESFSQGDSSITREYGGTGLGLAISRRLVEMMGGEIWVESTPGLGSTFHFTIQAAEVEPPDRPPVTEERRIMLSGHRVAVLGGQPGARTALIELLLGWRVRVTEGETITAEALEGVEAAIVFEDVFEEFSALSDRPPAVALVPLPDAELREAVNDAEIEAVVFRPLRQRALHRALGAVISGEIAIKSGPSFTAFDPTMAARVPARLLLGEDNPVNQRVAVAMLEKLGYSPDVVSDGVEALRALDRRDYDIVFLDLQMPGMDGLEATRQIRESHKKGSLWVVALTASTGAAQREMALSAGMDDFISKPFDVQRLMAAIERWAEGSAPVSETPPEPVPVDEQPSAWEQLQEMFSGAPEVLFPLIDDHIVNGASLVEAIRVNAKEGDREKVAIAAHTLKSSAAQFGSDELARIALAVEIEAKAAGGGLGPVEEIGGAWVEAEARLRQVSERLKRSVSPD